MASKRALFPYFGSKVRLACEYPPPIYDTIVEPFAGAAGYSAQYCDRRVVLFEKDPVVYGVLKFLVGASTQDILSLPLVPKGASVDDFDLTSEQKALIGFWLARGLESPRKRMGAWGKISSLTDVRFWNRSSRCNLAMVVKKIKHWKVYNSSYEDIDTRVIGDATWFVDPPYQVRGVTYKCGSKGIDYQRLGEWCRRLSGQVIVCENANANWLPFVHFHSSTGLQTGVVKDGKKKGKSEEVVWLKGCSLYPTLFSVSGNST